MHFEDGIRMWATLYSEWAEPRREGKGKQTGSRPTRWMSGCTGWWIEHLVRDRTGIPGMRPCAVCSTDLPFLARSPVAALEQAVVQYFRPTSSIKPYLITSIMVHYDKTIIFIRPRKRLAAGAFQRPNGTRNNS